MSRLVPSLAALALVACGGIAFVDSQGTGGAGGSGAAGGSGGAGAAGASGGSAGAGGFGCEGLGEVACLAAHPTCAPIYDDQCCSTCEPGLCSDCMNWVFVACFEQSVCTNGGPCGTPTMFGCDGSKPTCEDGKPCSFQQGCVELACAEGMPCPGTTLCGPVHGGLCTTQCNAPPPVCPDGTYPESDGFCYTGYCVPIELCLQG